MKRKIITQRQLKRQRKNKTNKLNDTFRTSSLSKFDGPWIRGIFKLSLTQILCAHSILSDTGAVVAANIASQSQNIHVFFALVLFWFLWLKTWNQNWYKFLLPKHVCILKFPKKRKNCINFNENFIQLSLQFLFYFLLLQKLWSICRIQYYSALNFQSKTTILFAPVLISRCHCILLFSLYSFSFSVAFLVNWFLELCLIIMRSPHISEKFSGKRFGFRFHNHCLSTSSQRRAFCAYTVHVSYCYTT